jgi:hypothetical protein
VGSVYRPSMFMVPDCEEFTEKRAKDAPDIRAGMASQVRRGNVVLIWDHEQKVGNFFIGCGSGVRSVECCYRLSGGVLDKGGRVDNGKGVVPHIRLGKAILYPVDSLRDWLQKQAQKKS